MVRKILVFTVVPILVLLGCFLAPDLRWIATPASPTGSPITSDWKQEANLVSPDSSWWLPLFDNQIFFCLEDRAGVGISDTWVQGNLSRHWKVNSVPSCIPGDTPNLRIIIEDFGSPQPAGWSRTNYPTNQRDWLTWHFYQHCEISLNAAIFWQRPSYVWPGTSTFLPDVPEKTLLHEFGHCASLPHREEPGYQGSMYPVMLYYPTEEEVASLRQSYNPWLFFQTIEEYFARVLHLISA